MFTFCRSKSVIKFTEAFLAASFSSEGSTVALLMASINAVAFTLSLLKLNVVYKLLSFCAFSLIISSFVDGVVVVVGASVVVVVVGVSVAVVVVETYMHVAGSEGTEEFASTGTSEYPDAHDVDAS